MQVASRGPDNLRGRSRSPEGRYQRDMPMHHSRRIIQAEPPFAPWALDEGPAPRSLVPAGPRMYSANGRQKIGERINELARPVGEDRDTSEWNEMLTFRSFVIMRVEEESSSSDAVIAYQNYKNAVEKERIPRFLWMVKEFPVILEKYEPSMRLRQFEETSQRCRSDASLFFKLLAEERFIGLSLVEKSSTMRSISRTASPFRLEIAPALENQTPVALTAPHWFPADPDTNCLCLRELRPHISKWDIKSHVIEHAGAEGLLDVSVTEPTGFELTLSGGSHPRCAWIQFTSEEFCTAAELKLEGTIMKDFRLHPLRRIPSITSCQVRVTPSETSHPARILRDLMLSAKLILKLDNVFGVSELILRNETVAADDFESNCLAHPVLTELHSILNGSGRRAEQQLDLQLLYLRVVHCVCYYSGRRFSSPRRLWDTVGPIYLRPAVDAAEVVRTLPGFQSEDSSSPSWDSTYTQGLDINSNTIPPTASLFLNDSLLHDSFEPNDDTATKSLKEEKVDEKIVKDELDDTEMTMNDDNPDIDLKTEIKDNELSKISRGRKLKWLTVLDARISWLLSENITRSTQSINEESPEIQEQWESFCTTVIEEVAAEKWRCALCAKMFRGIEFVKKHLKNKHTDRLIGIIPSVIDPIIIEGYHEDPYHHPIASPVIVPYVYRRGLPNFQHDSPGLGPTLHSTVLGLPQEFKQRKYRDLDAPRNEDKSVIKNIRETISYDDL